MNDEWDWRAFELAGQVEVTTTPPSSNGPVFHAVENVPRPAPAGLCRNCKTRPATTIWVADGGMLAYSHGGGVPWCQRCAVSAQLDFARKQAATITTLEQQLKQLP